MSQPTYQLPNRKWYTLEQAAKRINKLTGEEIEVADLLHYWKTNQLEICTPISYEKNSLYLGNQQIKNIKSFGIDFFLSDENYDVVTRTELFLMITSGEKKNDILQAQIDGMISLQPNTIYFDVLSVYFEFMPLDDGFIPLKCVDYLAIRKENNKKIYLSLNTDDDIKIPLCTLFILNDELDLFLQGKSTAIETAKEIESKQEKTPTTKTLNSQAECIRNLIIAHYGEEVANNIRKELENPNSEISKDFDKKGLKAPSGKAVDRWINQI